MDESQPINLDDNVTNGTNVTFKASPPGQAIAYSGLIILALIPIYIGSKKALENHLSTDLKKKENTEHMTAKDAAMFPVIASVALFSLYAVFKIFGKEYVNMLLTFYFVAIGVLSLASTFSVPLKAIMPSSFPNRFYRLELSEGDSHSSLASSWDFDFCRIDGVAFVLAALIGLWYGVQKHWIANNLFGLSFCTSAIEMLSLNTVKTGCILLGGLFIYDIFWVFFTEVMVLVAKSFEAPIKLVFPQDIPEHGILADKFSMLGLGDIVIPGIFIALMLRYDASRRLGSSTYFCATYFAYLVGLIVTIAIMLVFEHAQPALLYLVPACLGTPLLIAAVKGELGPMFAYADHEETEEGALATASPSNEVKKEK